MNPLKSVRATITLGFVLAVVIVLFLNDGVLESINGWPLVVWLHVFFGVIWIGLLYYFNFVQTEYVKEAEDSAKADVMKKLAPRALWWFRWAALFTFVTGLILLWFITNRLNLAFTFGAVMGTIMMLNVWGIIWPNQKKVLGIKDATADEKNLDHHSRIASEHRLCGRHRYRYFRYLEDVQIIGDSNTYFQQSDHPQHRFRAGIATCRTSGARRPLATTC